MWFDGERVKWDVEQKLLGNPTEPAKCGCSGQGKFEQTRAKAPKKKEDGKLQMDELDEQSKRMATNEQHWRNECLLRFCLAIKTRQDEKMTIR